MLDPTNETQVTDAYNHAREWVDGYFSSSFYSDAWTRHDKRLNAYYCRAQDSQTHWRSKLSLATFWLGCQAMHARFVDAHRTDPLIFVQASDDSKADAAAREKAQACHADLNYDLKRSGFRETLLTRMYPHVERFGVAVAREYIRTRQETTQRRAVAMGPYGQEAGSQTEQSVNRVEYTCTQPIHPLNFAHDMARSDFWQSTRSAVRFEMSRIDLYAMRGNPNFYQPGVETAIAAMESGRGSSWSTGRDSYYSEHGDDDTDRSHVLIVTEYYGPLWYAGNEGDTTTYQVLYCNGLDCVLQIGPSRFPKVPYWKLRAYADPEGPYGVGPCDMLLPIKAWEDKTVNQYVDYMNSALKYLWKATPGYLSGGLNSLINGLPGGILAIEEDDNGLAWQRAIEPLRTNQGTIPPVADVMGLIEKYKQNQGPSSNSRGQSSDQLDNTATGISVVAQREDRMHQAVQATCDEGIKNGCWIKVDAMTTYFSEPRSVEVERPGQGRVMVEHYPYELDGVDGYSFDIKRQTSDIEAGKNMSFLKLLMGITKMAPIPPETLIDTVQDVGVAMGIDNVKERMDKIRESVRPKVPGDLGAPGPGGPPGMAGAPRPAVAGGPGKPSGPGPVGPGGPSGPPAPAPAGAGAGNEAMAAALAG